MVWLASQVAGFIAYTCRVLWHR